jgi:type II secretory pathway pseudopilin PulG
MEVLVAMGILGVVFVGIYTAIATNIALVQLCRENETAIQLLTEKLETIRLYNWGQITATGFIPPTFTVALNPGDPTSPPYYSGTVTITTVPGSETYAQDLRLVTVKLNWVSNRRVQSRTLQTLVSKDGLQSYIHP